MKAWVQEHLPELNELAFNGSLRAEDLAAILSSKLLTRLPPARMLNTRQAWQVLIVLGCCGSSVERHAQQACVRRGKTAAAGTGLSWVTVRGGRQRFVEYFHQVADFVRHPYRDTFATFVEHNGPTIRVFHPATGKVLHTLSAAFDDGAYLTFSANPEERQFILLLKECAALQGAANLFLEKLQGLAAPLHDRRAVNAALHAATLLLAVRAKLQEFMAKSRFSAEFFLDVLRQYACPWSVSNPLRPPSGANDASALQRDVILFTDLIPAQPGFPGFRSHVRRVFSVLTQPAIDRIERSMAAPSIEARLLVRLGKARLSACDRTAVEVDNLLAAEPWLPAYVSLFEAQSQVSRTHYATVLKYLVRPKQMRDQQADPRERITIVPNTHGTTGMEPLGIMRDLDLARAGHLLRGIARHGKMQVRRQLEDWGVQRYSHAGLLALCAERTQQHSRYA
jgi:hypothetical protein